MSARNLLAVIAKKKNLIVNLALSASSQAISGLSSGAPSCRSSKPLIPYRVLQAWPGTFGKLTVPVPCISQEICSKYLINVPLNLWCIYHPSLKASKIYEWRKLYLTTGNSAGIYRKIKLKLLNYNYGLHYIKKLLSVNTAPYRTLLISRLNDLRDFAHLTSWGSRFHSVALL